MKKLNNDEPVNLSDRASLELDLDTDNTYLAASGCPTPTGLHEHLRALQGIIQRYDREVIALSEEIDARNRELIQKCESYRELEQENTTIKASLATIRKALHIDQEIIAIDDADLIGMVVSGKDVFVKDYQTAILGSNSSVISCDGGTSISENNSVSASDEDGISISKHCSTSISDNRGISISGNDGTSSSKNGGISITKDEGWSMSLHDGISISNHRGLSESGERGVSIAGLGGICCAGKNGVLVSRYWDVEATQIRTLCAHVGQGGIEPYKYYTIESGKFVEVEEPNKSKLSHSQVNPSLQNSIAVNGRKTARNK